MCWRRAFISSFCIPSVDVVVGVGSASQELNIQNSVSGREARSRNARYHCCSLFGGERRLGEGRLVRRTVSWKNRPICSLL